MKKKITSILSGLKISPLLFGASTLSGLLLALSFLYPKYFWILCFISLFPLGLACWKENIWQSFKAGWVTGLTMTLISQYWLPKVLIEFGQFNPVAAWLVFFLLGSYLAIYQGLFAALWAWLSKGKFYIFFTLWAALSWSGLDLLKNYMFTGYNWTPLAGGLVGKVQLLGAADLIGVYGLGFLIAYFNLSLVILIKNLIGKEKNKKTVFCNSLILIIIITFLSIYGFNSYKKWEIKSNSAPKYEVAIIQASVEQQYKWNSQYLEQILKRYENITKKALLKNPDIIIWPETSTPMVYLENTYGTEWLNYLVEDLQTPIILGITLFDDDFKHLKRNYYNGVLWFDHLGQRRQQYEKLHLVPFGEYIPLENLPIFKWSFAKNLIQGGSNTKKGRDWDAFEISLKNNKIFKPGIIICFESTFPNLARKVANQGSESLMILTNDTWFGTSRAPYQHWNHAVFRSIEVRRPVTRVANSGLSGIINPSGRSVFVSDLMAQESYQLELPEVYGDTFYQKTGDIIPLMGVFTTIISFIIIFFKRKPKIKNNKTTKNL